MVCISKRISISFLSAVLSSKIHLIPDVHVMKLRLGTIEHHFPWPCANNQEWGRQHGCHNYAALNSSAHVGLNYLYLYCLSSFYKW